MEPQPEHSTADQAALTKLAKFPSVPLLHGETPITRITGGLRVAEVGSLKLKLPQAATLSIKRDDLTPGFGNKTRKLELILADALAKRADCVITAGGPQSNHCRQTAQFARALGMDAHLMFGTASGERDFPCRGNQVVNRLFGATIHVCRKSERASAMAALAEDLRGQSKTPYVIPVGGSNHLGTLAYAKGFVEFLQQCQRSGEPFERIVVATSSGGTQAGLMLGAKLAGWPGEILGISIDQVQDDQEPDEALKYVRHMKTIANEALMCLESNARLSAADFTLNYDYLQGGYGVIGDYDRVGVMTLANHGIIAGPIYAGRAFGALLDLMAKDTIPSDGRTLFWLTGGAGEIEVYNQDLFRTR
jgi:D-cysteine desulfhydrase